VHIRIWKIFKSTLLINAIWSIGLLLISNDLFAQGKQKPEIKMISNISQDRILLRWAPLTPELWRIGNRYGYKLERFTLSENGVFDSMSNQKPILISTIPFKPLPKDQFDALSKEDPRAEVVKGILYSEEKKEAPTTANLIEKIQTENNQFGFALFACDQSVVAAKGHGLYYEDKNVKPNTIYAYRISLWENPTDIKVESSSIVVSMKDYFPLPKPKEFSIEFKDRKALLRWDVRYDKGVYGAYFIEKSEDGITFKKVNTLPYVQAAVDNKDVHVYFFEDSLAQNGKEYSYRIKGANMFGVEGPYSDIVKGKGVSELDILVIIDSVLIPNKEEIRLRWSVDGDDVKKIVGYNVLKSDQSDGLFIKSNNSVISNANLSFTDKNAENTTYYIVEAIGDQGQTVRSFSKLSMREDTMAPAIPVNLAGRINDTTGVVEISWVANTESDLMGYRVYRSSNRAAKAISIHDKLITVNQYRDTISLKSLNSFLYYYVVAFDANMNPSDMSAPLIIKRPDTIKPVAPVFTDVFMSGDSIYLKWINSSSKDLASAALYRIELDSKQTVQIDSFNFFLEQKTTFTDVEYEIGKRYQYAIETRDLSGNKTILNSTILETETGIRSAMNTLKAKADVEKNSIRLSWQYEGPEKVISYTLFKAKNKMNPMILSTLKSNQENYIDTDLKLGNEYSYSIKAELEKGIETELSKPIKVTF
jgi:uncharacterized protein